ncbi:MAG: hypothetical protein KGM24_09285, partial [Elusimicrobia bacterium]|nr:hypothetical protein [Elusimicrobiota bacterium]
MTRRAFAALFALGLLLPAARPCAATTKTKPSCCGASRPAKARRPDPPACCRFAPAAASTAALAAAPAVPALLASPHAAA